MDGRGGKLPTILAESLTPKDSKLEPVTSPRTERVCTRLTNWANPWGWCILNYNLDNSRWIYHVQCTFYFWSSRHLHPYNRVKEWGVRVGVCEVAWLVSEVAYLVWGGTYSIPSLQFNFEVTPPISLFNSVNFGLDLQFIIPPLGLGFVINKRSLLPF